MSLPTERTDSERASLAAAPTVTPARWDVLRRYTDARIALGRAGHSMPTAAHLAYQLAHARARDAVRLPFDALGVAAALDAAGCATLLLNSAATDQATYLQRPDLGRQLDDRSRVALGAQSAQADRQSGSGALPRDDVAVVIADGLSALAVHQHAVALVSALRGRLQADAALTWTLAPIAVVTHGRVAIGDAIGQLLRANCVVVLIGERPGLSSPDSLGVYITWAPRVGLTDAQRNCISNVRPAGLAIEAAATKLHQLLTQARRSQLTGVGLKDDHDDAAPAIQARASSNFLLAGQAT